MNKKIIKPLVILGILASFGGLAYIAWKRRKAQKDTEAALNTGGAGGPSGGSPGSSAGCANCPSYTAAVQGELSLVYPAANFKKCGPAVANLQQQINLIQTGSNLVIDGCYGPKTQAAHEQLLAINNGVWPTSGPTNNPQFFGFMP